MTLKELQIGKSAVVDTVGGSGALRQHFLDMGLIPGAEVTLVKLAPMGDPMELRIHGYELTLRLDDAAQIGITPTEKAPAMSAAPADDKMVDHPGLGEGGKYHIKKGENPLPEDRTLTFALAGNQNCGKTTLFNQLTGSNQHVGNFPGVTVDRKSGAIKGHPETEVTDLPGIYSMSPYSSEEIVTRQFIIGEKPTGIINIVDATNIERNLYLTMQLMELDIPMVLALNMMDEVRGNGGTVRINKMEAMLGIPVIPISAAKNEGVDELVDHALHVAKYQERPGRMDFCSEDDHGGAVHRCIHGIIHLIEDHAKAAGIPVRFAATKLVEGDPRIEEALKLDQNEKEMIEHIIVQMEQERGLDRAAAIADMRFSFIQELVAKTVVKPHESKEQLRSNRIDKFLTGKYTAIPAFVGIMALIFWLTFNVIGRHQSRLVRTRVCSNKSPWLAGTKVGDIYTVPISHGEGRFLASEELVKKLAENGQIATQYVDLDGYATMDAAFNPNGSICAIEGITSPDGRVFGKMGHTERIGKELYRNVPGQYEMELFTSAVRYFK